MSQQKTDDRIAIQRALILSRLALDESASKYNRYSSEFRELSRAKRVIGELSKKLGGRYEIRRED